MRRVLAALAILILPALLSACSGGDGAPGAEDEARIRDAVAFIAATEGGPGVFVKGRDIVVNYARRPAAFADTARDAVLAANRATGGRQVKLYVVDSAQAATALPRAGQYYCSITASDNRLAGNNC